MTLFKKVFQNQSRPATADEALDEAALRSVFVETAKPAQPLVLDPFQHGLPSDDGDVAPGVAPEAVVHDITDTSEAEDAHAGRNMAWDADVLDADAIEEVDPLEHDMDAPDTLCDENIVARLDRALAAEPPVSHKVKEDADDTVVSDESTDHLAPDLCVETGTDAANCTKEEGLDTAAFAQRQMATLGDAEQQPVCKADADKTVSEPLDLSGGALASPATGRGRRAGRVKTRLLGFNHAPEDQTDPFEQAQSATATAQREKFPVGWLVIVEGPGLGHAFSIFAGASMIGRGEDQVIRLDFGDNAISRHHHAAVAYDEEQNKFYIGHGGKSNIIRRNARPVLSTEELHHADLIRIGETTLRFVALCGSDFQWHGAGGQ